MAILPYLEESGTALYKEFHLDEPWESEHNRELIKRMPMVFRDPHEDPSSTSASYFMPTGKGTFGDSEKGLTIKDIRDGTANTIMIVEAKRDIPWTKPDDIEIDADLGKRLPKFGGHLSPEGSFAAAFADGSVRLLSETLPDMHIRNMLTIAGGEAGFSESPSSESSKLAAPAGMPAATRSPDGNQRMNLYLRHNNQGKVAHLLERRSGERGRFAQAADRLECSQRPRGFDLRGGQYSLQRGFATHGFIPRCGRQ